MTNKEITVFAAEGSLSIGHIPPKLTSPSNYIDRLSLSVPKPPVWYSRALGAKCWDRQYFISKLNVIPGEHPWWCALPLQLWRRWRRVCSTLADGCLKYYGLLNCSRDRILRYVFPDSVPSFLYIFELLLSRAFRPFGFVSGRKTKRLLLRLRNF